MARQTILVSLGMNGFLQQSIAVVKPSLHQIDEGAGEPPKQDQWVVQVVCHKMQHAEQFCAFISAGHGLRHCNGIHVEEMMWLPVRTQA